MVTVAAVLTYPAHFLHTSLTLASIKKFHLEIDALVVILDDTSNLCWPGYIKDAGNFYKQHGADILLASQLPFMRYLTHPWVRQQTIKLYMDQLLDCHEWFYSDGDCVLLDRWPDHVISAHPVPCTDLSCAFRHYVSEMLSLPDWPGFLDAQARLITSSAPPVRYMSSDVLQDLRRHVHGIHGAEIWEIHNQNMRMPHYRPTEWELIDCYRSQIRHEPEDFQNLRHMIRMGWDADKQHDIEWWHAQGVSVDKDVWQKLPLARYI